VRTELLAYLSLKTAVLRCQQETGTVKTLEILTRIIEEIGQHIENIAE
jgi:hypothetical protein